MSNSPEVLSIPVIGHRSQKSLHCGAVHVHSEGLSDGCDVGDPLLPSQKVHHEARQHRGGTQHIADYQITEQHKHGSMQVLVYDNDAHHHTVPQQHHHVVKESQEEQERSVAWRYREALQLEHDRLPERSHH